MIAFLSILLIQVLIPITYDENNFVFNELISSRWRDDRHRLVSPIDERTLFEFGRTRVSYPESPRRPAILYPSVFRQPQRQGDQFLHKSSRICS